MYKIVLDPEGDGAVHSITRYTGAFPFPLKQRQSAHLTRHHGRQVLPSLSGLYRFREPRIRASLRTAIPPAALLVIPGLMPDWHPAGVSPVSVSGFAINRSAGRFFSGRRE